MTRRDRDLAGQYITVVAVLCSAIFLIYSVVFLWQAGNCLLPPDDTAFDSGLPAEYTDQTETDRDT